MILYSSESTACVKTNNTEVFHFDIFFLQILVNCCGILKRLVISGLDVQVIDVLARAAAICFSVYKSWLVFKVIETVVVKFPHRNDFIDDNSEE